MKNYAIGLYEKAIPKDMDWEGKLNCAKDCGYDFLEISIDETDEKLSRLDWSKEQRMEMLQLMQKTGLPIRSMCLSGHRKYSFFSSAIFMIFIQNYFLPFSSLCTRYIFPRKS